jgi:hypothetical protein
MTAYVAESATYICVYAGDDPVNEGDPSGLAADWIPELPTEAVQLVSNGFLKDEDTGQTLFRFTLAFHSYIQHFLGRSLGTFTLTSDIDGFIGKNGVPSWGGTRGPYNTPVLSDGTVAITLVVLTVPRIKAVGTHTWYVVGFNEPDAELTAFEKPAVTREPGTIAMVGPVSRPGIQCTNSGSV